MRAMASSARPYRSGAVAAKLGRKTTEVSMTREHLIEKGLVTAPRTMATLTSRSPGSTISCGATCPTGPPAAAQRKRKP